MGSLGPVDSERAPPVQYSIVLGYNPLQTYPPPDPLPELANKERRELIKKLGEYSKVGELPSAYWACLWLEDIELLRQDIEVASKRGSLLNIAMDSKRVPYAIRTCKPSMPSTPCLTS